MKSVYGLPCRAASVYCGLTTSYGRPTRSAMQTAATASVSDSALDASKGGTRHILGFVYFTFICYLSIGLPLAVLPPYVHYRMGFSAALASLVITIQYVATLVSRPWAGRISDRAGAKVSVLWGMGACTTSGALLVAAAAAMHLSAPRLATWISLSILMLSRLVLGVGESLGSTGSTLWGITSAGSEHTARVISFNGISTYGAMAIGAPLGVVLEQHWGLASLGFVTILIGAISLALAFRKAPVHAVPGERLPFARVFFRVAPHGMGLALGGVGYSVLATFITLFYAHRHWDGAALCLTSFGAAFILARLLFIQAINRFGGFPVGMACLSVESLGMVLLWQSSAPWMAFLGAAFAGLGFSLVFPSFGVEAVKRVTKNNRGSALGVYTAFADVSFFLTGPMVGTVLGVYGYSAVFFFAFLSVLTALAIAIVLRQRQSRDIQSP